MKNNSPDLIMDFLTFSCISVSAIYVKLKSDRVADMRTNTSIKPVISS